jgi:DnaJ-class molecular chaperone
MKVKCPQCSSKGEYETISTWEGKEIQYPVKCNLCDGSGKVEKSATYTGKRRVKGN